MKERNVYPHKFSASYFDALAREKTSQTSDAETPDENIIDSPHSDQQHSDQQHSDQQSESAYTTPINQPLDHPTLTTEIIGSALPKLFFVADIDNEMEAHPSLMMIEKIAEALGHKDSFSILLIKAHKRHLQVTCEDHAFAKESLQRLISERLAPDTRCVLMGAHTLALTNPGAVFYELNASMLTLLERPFLVTWHPVDMLKQPLLKKDCWDALNSDVFRKA